MENKFIAGTRQKVRFESKKGLLTIEDLWYLPLTHKTGFDLDSVAISINKELKEKEEESFVKKTTKENEELHLKLDIVKYIIEVKMKEQEERKLLAEKKAKREKLLQLIEEKQEDELKSKSLDELKKELEALD